MKFLAGEARTTGAFPSRYHSKAPETGPSTISAGIAFNPLLLAAMSGVEPTEAGLASGVVNTAFMMGGALGLAVLASLAASRSDTLIASGDGQLVGLNGG